MLTKRPNDGRDYDCRCGRCGSSIEWVKCDYAFCNEGRIWDDDIDDECHECGGKGGSLECSNFLDWCQANPLEGREDVEPGTVEWFLSEGS